MATFAVFNRPPLLPRICPRAKILIQCPRKPKRMAELLAYAPTEPTAEIRKNPRGFPTVEEYAVSARESSRATAERRVAEITETSEDLKGLQGEFLSAEEIRSLIEGVESEKGILLASL